MRWLVMLVVFVSLTTNAAGAAIFTFPLPTHTPFPNELPHLCDVENCSPLAKEWLSDYRDYKSFVPRSKSDAYDGKCEMQGRNAFGDKAFMIFQMSAVADQIYFDGRFSGPVMDAATGRPNFPSWYGETKDQIKSEMSGNDGNPAWAFHFENDFAYVDARTPKQNQDFVIWIRSNASGSQVIVMGYFSLQEEFVCQLQRLN